jgi:hypothetical protein
MESGPWYSQDLTAATDLHPFWLQRQFYEELLEHHPSLEKYRKWFPLLFGRRKLIQPDDFRSSAIEPPDNPYASFLEMRWDEIYGHVSVAGKQTGRTTDYVVDPFYEATYACQVDPDDAAMYIYSWQEFLTEVIELPYVLTRTGNPMGEAASFPLLPLVTIHAAERAGLPSLGGTGDDARIPLGQKSKPLVLQEPFGSLSHGMRALLGRLPPRWEDWEPVHRLMVHEFSLGELGAVLSRGDEKEGKPNKIFLHSTYHLYKEIPMKGDFKIPFMPTKLLSAPPGGSKGSVSWFNQPTAVRQHCAEMNFRLPKWIWRKLPYWNDALAAFSNGIPVREPVTLGGINHPAFPHTAGISSRYTQAWLSTLSQLTLVHWATGTGLSPLPSPQPALSRKAAQRWLEEELREGLAQTEVGAQSRLGTTLIPFDKEGRGSLPSLKEAADLATASSSAYLLYAAKPQEFLKTPTLKVVSEKFRRKIKKGGTFLKRKAKNGEFFDLTYAGTMRDVARKQSVYLVDPDTRIPGKKAPRPYGLEASKHDPTRAPWRWDWLERQAPTDLFVRAFFPTLEGLTDLPGTLS